MRNLFNSFLRTRVFLNVSIAPVLLLTSQCPTIFQPPPQAGSCPTIPVTLDMRRCIVVEPPCTGTFNWQPGDTFSIPESNFGNLPFDSFNQLRLEIEEIRSGSYLMRRFCQRSNFTANVGTGRAKYQYTFQNTTNEGIYNVSLVNQSAFTVAIEDDFVKHAVYDYKQPGNSVVLQADAEDGMPPYTYRWTANGVLVPTAPGDPPSVMRHFPTQNTEYRVRVIGQGEAQGLEGVVVFFPNAADPTAAFTISPQTIQTGQIVTLNSSTSTGNITRWDWDFDWHGDILEPFNQTIIGPSGTVTTMWAQGGRKYIRLRATTASGNFHEIFQSVRVQ